MKCNERAMTLLALVFGTVATTGLFLALTTTYWLYTTERPEQLSSSAAKEKKNTTREEGNVTYAHLGLWRVCLYSKQDPDRPSECASIDYLSKDPPQLLGPERKKLPSEITLALANPDRPSECASIDYLSKDPPQLLGPERKKLPSEITLALAKGTGIAAPLCTSGLVLLLIGIVISAIGIVKRDFKILIGSVFHILAGLCLASAVIIYISAINDEVAHRPQPQPDENPENFQFIYTYGWSFYFAGFSFIFTELDAIISILLYLKRYKHLDDKIQMVPGLYRKIEKHNKGGHTNQSCDTSVEANTSTRGSPTLIL
ncbi:voltage-dependent calcium channel gamma-5 subunit-like [Lingula anatina]|uniref:Voltage-dependent calcium channel gamma-5 subunit-like n=1 Tax=Lingula anatina TaxID=7574 RepID=A0A2R2MM89_LINAN|nr:voltage-dependent calcium channel gamma-5 subunit-like [Lingula anatina]|eukprot:XP_023931325.1 voltage-dependent calcium channel gamma-5 subunit-like [Lingula anatina]